MTDVFSGLLPRNDFNIDANLSNTPMFIVDDKYKILRRNEAARYLLGAEESVDVCLPKNCMGIIDENDFTLNPCVCPEIADELGDKYVVFVCRYYDIEGCTIWFFIKKGFGVTVEKYKHGLMAFLPSFSSMITFPKASDKSYSKNELFSTMCKRLVLSAVDNFSAVNRSNVLEVESVVRILKMFAERELGIYQYNFQLTDDKHGCCTLLTNSNNFMCVYLCMLVNVSLTSASSVMDIRVINKNNKLTIETYFTVKNIENRLEEKYDVGRASRIMGPDILIFEQICKMLDFEIDVKSTDEANHNFKISLTAGIVIPNMLNAPVDDLEIENIYSKFMLFLLVF